MAGRSLSVVALTAALIGTCGCSGRGGTHASATTTTVASSRTVPAVTETDLVRRWRPIAIAGYHGPLGSPPLAALPDLGFDGFGRGAGSDGCNGYVGSYRLGSAGRFHLFGPGTAVPCNVAVRFPAAASRVALGHGRLTFCDRRGHEVARYARLDITARIVLPARAMVAGSSMPGRVIVENHAGRAQRVESCGPFLRVALANDTYEPHVAWLSCGGQVTVPVGTSTYPVTVDAFSLGCAPHHFDGEPPYPRHGSPPLQPGRYRATLFTASPIVSATGPIAVRVTH